MNTKQIMMGCVVFLLVFMTVIGASAQVTRDTPNTEIVKKAVITDDLWITQKTKTALSFLGLQTIYATKTQYLFGDDAIINIDATTFNLKCANSGMILEIWTPKTPNNQLWKALRAGPLGSFEGNKDLRAQYIFKPDPIAGSWEAVGYIWCYDTILPDVDANGIIGQGERVSKAQATSFTMIDPSTQCTSGVSGNLKQCLYDSTGGGHRVVLPYIDCDDPNNRWQLVKKCTSTQYCDSDATASGADCVTDPSTIQQPSAGEEPPTTSAGGSSITNPEQDIPVDSQCVSGKIMSLACPGEEEGSLVYECANGQYMLVKEDCGSACPEGQTLTDKGCQGFFARNAMLLSITGIILVIGMFFVRKKKKK